ncbi:MAG: hypothetical protein SVJ22_09585, partial [Halobacteriota archaeon]|nr:hypothetical protein [Halobacteriota archaeon]
PLFILGSSVILYIRSDILEIVNLICPGLFITSSKTLLGSSLNRFHSGRLCKMSVRRYHGS